MRAPSSIIGTLATRSLLASAWKRAIIFVVLIGISGALAFFPQRQRAVATLTPTDPQTMGLSDTLGQLGALNSVFGKQADVEVALRVGTSMYMRDTVIQQLNLHERTGIKGRVELHRWLEDKIDIRSLRGGIIMVEMTDTDGDLALDIVTAVGNALRERLAEINVRQTQYKREILEQLVEESSDRMIRARNAYNAFRMENGYVDPGNAVTVIGSRVPALQQQLNDLDAQLAAARAIYADDNMIVVQLMAERNALSGQLAEAREPSLRSRNQSVGEAIGISNRLFELEREFGLARSLYNSYQRSLEGTSVEDLTSTANIRMLEEPYVDTERQIWKPAAAAAIALLLLWLAMEFYRLRPPLGARLKEDEHVAA
jgi:uncharacterized protein involved in exopolysaccharide biosynthesis